MRDQVERETQVVKTITTTVASNVAPTETTSSTYTATNTVVASARADIQQGNFVLPTRYNAYRVITRPIDMHVKTNPEVTRRWGYVPGVGAGWRTTARIREATGYAGFYFEADCVYLGLRRYTYTPDVSSAVVNRTVNKALSKLKRQEASLGATLGEITELRGMLINKFVLLVRTFLLVKKGKLDEAARLMRLQKQKALGRPHLAFANAWLALELGWRPLMQEIFGLQEAIKNIADKSELTLRVTAVSERELTLSYFSPYSLSGISEGCQIGIVAKMDPNFPGWLRRLGAGNPASIAWELTTLSFVIDWFVGIGNFLNLLDATHTLEFVSAYETTFVKGKGTLTDKRSPMNGVDESDCSIFITPSWDVDVFSMKRTTGRKFPNARLTLGDGLSNAWRQITSTALVAARTGDKVKPMNNWRYGVEPTFNGWRQKR